MKKILESLKDFCIFYTVYRGMEHFSNLVRGIFGYPLMPLANETATLFFCSIFGLILFVYLLDKYTNYKSNS